MLNDAPQLSNDPCAFPIKPGECGFPKDWKPPPPISK
jgi:hypothetical protein